MATITAILEDSFSQYGGQSEGESASFVPFIFAEITAENVREVLLFVASKPALNRAFWRRVNDAPRTEDEWQSSVYICSGGEEMQHKMKASDRRAVEIVRDTIPRVQQNREALFRREA